MYYTFLNETLEEVYQISVDSVASLIGAFNQAVDMAGGWEHTNEIKYIGVQN